MSTTRRCLHHPVARIIAGIAVCLLVPVAVKIFVLKPILEATGLAEETARDTQCLGLCKDLLHDMEKGEYQEAILESRKSFG